MTPKEEQKCQHVWCDIKGNECGKCHLCGAERPPIQSWEERFDHNWDYDGSWQVPDRDMIKDFIRDLLQEQKEELLRVIEEMKREIGEGTYCLTCKQHIAAGDCNCTGRNAALEELKRTITGV